MECVASATQYDTARAPRRANLSVGYGPRALGRQQSREGPLAGCFGAETACVGAMPYRATLRLR